MNKRKIVALLTCCLLLTGCRDKVKELYAGNAYATGDFVQNYYSTWNNDLKEKVSSTIDIDISNNAGVDYKQKTASGITPSLTYIKPIDQINNDTHEYLDWYHDTPISDAGVGYGPTKNLSSIDKSFSYGYLSKLYDGRIQCDGYYAKSRVQLDSNGYGTSFPKELVSAKYMALSLRGGTTCERSFDNENLEHFGIYIDLHISLYSYDFNSQTYTEYKYTYIDCPIITNSSGHTELISFYFENEVGAVPNNVTAMSLTYELKSTQYANIVTDINEYKNDEEKELFALMLYEVLIPDSTWR